MWHLTTMLLLDMKNNCLLHGYWLWLLVLVLCFTPVNLKPAGMDPSPWQWALAVYVVWMWALNDKGIQNQQFSSYEWALGTHSDQHWSVWRQFEIMSSGHFGDSLHACGYYEYAQVIHYSYIRRGDDCLSTSVIRVENMVVFSYGVVSLK